MSTSYEVHKIYKFGTMEFYQEDDDNGLFVLHDEENTSYSVRLTIDEVAALCDIINVDFADLA